MRKFCLQLFLGLVFCHLLGTTTIVYAKDFLDQSVSGPTDGWVVGTLSEPSMREHVTATQQFDQGIVNGNGTVQFQLSSALLSVSDLIVPTDPSGQIMVNKGGALGFLANSIGNIAGNPPLSGTRYLQYVASSIRIPGSPAPAYAQSYPNGIGYSGLNPILAIWTASRNVAYLFFTIVFVIVGFMIIFRVKIDPKTVITIQSAIPKIVVALLLVTFSYAIAGLLIDLMYLLIALFISLFSTVKLSNDPATQSAIVSRIGEFKSSLPRDNIFGVFGGQQFFDVAGSTSAAIGSIVKSFITSKPSGTEGSFGDILGFGASAIAWFVITVAILIALFRTFLTLIGAYVQIILGTITAPLFLLMEAVPGRGSFGSWLRMMLSNILVFPFVILMIMVGYVLTASWSSGAGFVPPLIGGNSPGAIQGLIGLGIILSMPKAINMLQEVLKAPPFKYGNAWSEPLQAAGGLAAGPVRGRAYESMYNRVQDADPRLGFIYRGILQAGYNRKWWGSPPPPKGGP